jgi:glutamine cyclotransferase
LLLSSCGDNATRPIISVPFISENVPLYTYEVVDSFPHDEEAFTQGLIFHDGYLLESTGLYGQSTLRRVTLESGEVQQAHELEAMYFAEGIALVGDRIFQITWQRHVAFVYDLDTFAAVDTFTYSGAGWGLTYDGTHLIMTDGTATMDFRDPETFEVVRQVEVRDEDGPVPSLNELEYIDGRVFANVYQTDLIVVIDPETGMITNQIDLTGLLEGKAVAEPARAGVLNGIAFDPAADRLLVTGKLWPTLFEIELVPVDTDGDG